MPKADEGPAAVAREFFVRYTAGDLRGAASLWMRGAPAEEFVRRHRIRLEKRCMRLESLAIEVVSNDPVVLDATSTMVLHAASSGSAEWWESAHSRITLQRDGAEWRIAAWEPREQELVERFLAAKPEDRALVLESSPELHTTTFVRLAAQRGVDLVNKGGLDDAVALSGAAFTVAERLGEPAAMSAALSAGSVADRIRANIDASLTRAEQALALAEGAGDPDVLGRALLRLTRTREYLAGIPAPELVARALELSDSLEEIAIAAHAAVHLGRASELRGRLREAFRLAERAWLLAEESGDLAARTSAAMLLHGAYSWIGDTGMAPRYGQHVIELSREAGFEGPAATGVAGMAARLAREDPAGARRILDEELRRTTTPTAVASLLRARARIARRNDRFEEAQRDLDRILELLPLDAASRQDTEVDLAALARDRGDYDRAMAHAQAGRGANVLYSRTARYLQADVLARLGRIDEARAMLDELLTEEGEAGLVNPQLSLFHSIEEPTRQLLMEVLVVQGDLVAALREAEVTKSQGLTEALSHGKHARPGAPEEHPRERAMEARIQELNRHLASGTLSGAAAAAVREQLNAARVDLLDLRQRTYVGRPAPPIERSAALCIDELPPHLDEVTIVSYSVGALRTLVFVLGPKRDGKRELTVRSIEIAWHELRARVGELALLVEQRNLRAASVAARMHDLLIGPIESEVRDARSLCIVPDSSLWRVPFQILGPESGPLLVDRMPVFYAPSITVLAAARPHDYDEAQPRAEKPRLLAFANPSVGTETASLYRAFDPDAPLGAIPETETEVRAIARIYGDDASRIYVGKTARETTLKQEASRFDVLHIATHGVVYDSTPMFSSLLLTAAPDDENDGVLEAREIATLALDADLAVLSACETGRANVTGSGVIGLSWAFLAAGCPTTVVSQWKTHSAAAAMLMVEFHRQLARGQSKPEALRRAQVALRRDRRYRHPFYWAPFVVIGTP